MSILEACATTGTWRTAAIIGNTLHYEAVDGSYEMWVRTSDDGTYRNTVLNEAKAEPPRLELAGTWTQNGKLHCRQQQLADSSAPKVEYCENVDYFPQIGSSGFNENGMQKLTLLPGEKIP